MWEEVSTTEVTIVGLDLAIAAVRARRSSQAGVKPARLLINNALGHTHYRFFTEIGQTLPEDQTGLQEPSEPGIQSVLSFAEKVGVTFVAPAEAPA